MNLHALHRARRHKRFSDRYGSPGLYVACAIMAALTVYGVWVGPGYPPGWYENRYLTARQDVNIIPGSALGASVIICKDDETPPEFEGKCTWRYSNFMKGWNGTDLRTVLGTPPIEPPFAMLTSYGKGNITYFVPGYMATNKFVPYWRVEAERWSQVELMYVVTRAEPVYGRYSINPYIDRLIMEAATTGKLPDDLSAILSDARHRASLNPVR